MLVATFGEGTEWAGKTITYADGVFTLEGQGELSADEVMRRGRQGDLEWASEATPFWVAALAHTPPPPEKHATPPWVWAVVAVAAVAMIAVVAGFGFFMRDAMHDDTPQTGAGTKSSPSAAPATPVTASATQDGGSWLTLLTWSGGGRGTLVRQSDTFEVKGPRQRISTFWDRVSVGDSVTRPQWRVVSAHDGSVVQFVTPTAQSEVTPYRLEPGTYYLSSNTTDCIWRITVEDFD